MSRRSCLASSRFVVAAAAAVFAFGMFPAHGQDGTIIPGRVVGELRFQNPSAGLLSQCAADPAATPPSGNAPVFLRSLTASMQAQGSYTAMNAMVGTEFSLGSYDLRPNTSGASSSFLISTEAATFTSGAQYRFGSRFASGAGVRICADVLPTTIDPAGRRCDQSECAALLDVRFRLTGDSADLDALDTSLLALPATCTAQSSVREPSVGGYADLQATSAPVAYPVADLVAAGYRTIPLLVRGNAEAVVSIQCQVPLDAGTTGFVIVPGTNLTPLSASRTLTPACAPSGTPSPALQVTFDIPVARTAGGAKGKLDLVGFPEEGAKVHIGGIGTQFIAVPQVDSANPAGPLVWAIEGVPSGQSAVLAQSLADQRDKFVIFPARDGLNMRVPVIPGAVSDLGATFVARPRSLLGSVALFDFGNTDLAWLTLGQFSPMESTWYRSTSHAEAQGNTFLPQAGGASGIGGLSRGRLRGAYDRATGRAALDFHLLLPGIGERESSLDGLQARNVSWDFTSLFLRIDPEGVYEELTVRPGALLRVDSGSPPSPTAALAADQAYCFGRETITLRVDPALGTLYAPSANFASTSSYEPVAAGTTPVAGSSANVRRLLWFDSRATTVDVPATLVAGLGYAASAYVLYSPAGATSEAQSTYVVVPSISVPPQSVVQCAGDGETCVSIDGSTGSSTSLSVTIADATGVASPSYCLAAGPAGFVVKVNSQSPRRVSTVLDPPAGTEDCAHPGEQVHCDGSCNANAQFTVNFASLGAGTHVLRACASDTAGCLVHRDFAFEVRTQDLAITCPGPITVNLDPGETALSRTDPRIAPQLHATVAGTCGIPQAVSDNAPASFPVGTTSVTFSAQDVGSCATTVIVNPYLERQLGVKSMRAGSNALDIYRATNPVATLLQTVLVGAPFEFAFAPDGARVAIVRRDGLAAVIDLDAVGASTDFASSPAISLQLKPPHAVAWNRGANAFAVVGRKATGAPVPAIKVIRAVFGEPATVMQTAVVPVPSGFDARGVGPFAIAYSTTGSRFVLAASGPRPNIATFANFALSASTQTSGKIVESTWRTAQTAPTAAAAREEVLDLSVSSTQTTIATTRVVYRLNASATAWEPVRPQLTYDAALVASGKAVAFIEDVAGNRQRVSLAVLGMPMVRHTPSFAPSGKGEVALAHDGRRAAAANQGGILVFGGDLAQISVISDVTAGGPRFRPGS